MRRLEPVRQLLQLLVLTFRLALDESDDSQKSYSQQKHGSRFWYRSTIGCREAVRAACPVSGENERPCSVIQASDMKCPTAIDDDGIGDCIVSPHNARERTQVKIAVTGFRSSWDFSVGDPHKMRTDRLDDAPVKCVELWQGSNGD